MYRFNRSKYTTWYYTIIQRARAACRSKGAGLVNHHILPSCLGGSDDLSNRVLLTHREHYVCHLLLIKMTSGIARSKMVYAFFRFCPKEKGTRFTSSKMYVRFVASFRHDTAGRNNAFYGRHHSVESKQKIVSNHGMRGRSAYDVWMQLYGKAEADRRLAEKSRKQSAALKGKNNPQYGKLRTKTQRAHQSRLMRGAGNPNYGKKWYWIHKGKKTKRVQAVEAFLADGWTLGRSAVSNETKSMARTLRKKGYKYTEIMATLKLSHSMVWRLCRHVDAGRTAPSRRTGRRVFG